MTMRKDILEAKEKFCPLIFEKSRRNYSDTASSIISVLENGPIAYNGESGKSKAEGGGSIVFEFMNCKGTNNSAEVKSQRFIIHIKYDSLAHLTKSN